MPKKHYESQVENKILSKHSKYGTLAYFITNNLQVLQPSLDGKHVIIYNWCFFFFLKNVWLINIGGRLSYSCVRNFRGFNSRRVWWNILKPIKMGLGVGQVVKPLSKTNLKSATGGVFVKSRNLPIPSIRHATVRVLRKTPISRLPKCNWCQAGKIRQDKHKKY